MPEAIDLSRLADGTYTVEDDGVPGNGISVIRNAKGSVVATVNHSIDPVTILATAGQHLIFNVTDTFGQGSLIVGNLADPLQSPDSIQIDNLGDTEGTVTLVANGTITEFGSDSDPDIVAGSLVLRAGTGIGAVANALETQVAAIEAATETGGITLLNSGAVTIGGLAGEIAGLEVLNSGDIRFTSLGSIDLADTTGLASVNGAATGNILLTASGSGSDLTSSVDHEAIRANGGSIYVSAGRDILLGTAGANFNNGVHAGGELTFNAGRDLVHDGHTGFSGANVTITAGRDIGVLGFDPDGIQIGINGSSVILTTGADGTATFSDGSHYAIWGSEVVISADRIVRGSSYIRSDYATLKPVTLTREIHLGVATDTGFALELSSAEMAFNGFTLVIGSFDSGQVGVYSDITFGPQGPGVNIQSGASIVIGGDIVAPYYLTLEAANNVVQLAGTEIFASELLIFVDFPDTDPGLGGSVTLDGIETWGSSLIGGGSDADTLNGNDTTNFIIGFGGNDTLNGNGGNDNLVGRIGDDILTGGDDDDTLDGGKNYDTAVFSGNSGAYSISRTGGETVVEGPDGTDTLTNVERLQFGDANYVFATRFHPPSLFVGTYGAAPEAGGWSDNLVYPRLVADIDGDGRGDIVGFGSAGVYASLTTAAGAAGAAYLALATFGAAPEAGGWSDSRVYPRMLGDIDGDSLADLVGFGSAGAYAALAIGGGQFAQPFLASNTFGASPAAGGWSDNLTYPRMLADTNGDGNADLIGFGSAGVYVALGSGTGQFGQGFLASSTFGQSAAAGGWSDNDLYTRTFADINGDGREDIVGFGAAGTYAALAQADGSFGAGYLAYAGFGAAGEGGGWSSNDLYYRTLADTDGDGHADLVGFGEAGVFVARGDGAGGFALAELALAKFGTSAAAGGWTSQDTYPRMFADMDGDGAADIVGFGSQGVYVALSASEWVVG